jgi:cell division protein FtsB
MAGRSKYLDPSKVPLKQRPQGNIWAILVQITQFMLLLAFVAALVLCFLPVIQEMHDQRERLEMAKNRTAEGQAAGENKRREIELLKHNEAYVLRLARDKLNLGRPGEVIFRFDPYRPEDEPPSGHP